MTATRNKIPTVKPIVSSGTISLNFTYRGQRYKKSLGKESKATLREAESLSDRINLDLASGRFTGLEPYFPELTPVTPKPDQGKPSQLTPVTVLERYLSHLESVGSSSSHIAQYRALKGNLERSGLEWLSGKLPRYKTLLKTAYSHLKLDCPDLSNFHSQKAKQEKDITTDIISQEQITAILQWFSESYDYSHYYSFVKFRFLTGCRPCEAIGLLWEDVDFQNSRITIKRSHTANDGLKGRKNGSVTYLPINQSLKALLSEQRAMGLHSEIVFPSPKGTFINVQNFARRAWSECCKALKLGDIRFYSIRHTVLSNLVQSQGLASAAYVAGHKSLEMVQRHYGKLLSVPELPSL